MRAVAASVAILLFACGCSGALEDATSPAGDGAAPAPIQHVAAVDPGPSHGPLRACLDRFDADDFFPNARVTDPTWHERGAQRIASRIQQRLSHRFGDERDSLAAPRNGYLTTAIDTAGSRLVVLVDDSLIDRPTLRCDLNRVARKIAHDTGLRGAPVKVQVAASCFPAEELLRVRDKVIQTLAAASRAEEAAGRHPADAWALYGIDIDSRLRILLPERYKTTGDALQRRFGSRIAITYAPGARPLRPPPARRAARP